MTTEIAETTESSLQTGYTGEGGKYIDTENSSVSSQPQCISGMGNRIAKLVAMLNSTIDQTERLACLRAINSLLARKEGQSGRFVEEKDARYNHDFICNRLRKIRKRKLEEKEVLELSFQIFFFFLHLLASYD